jgi:hypothetical protein
MEFKALPLHTDPSKEKNLTNALIDPEKRKRTSGSPMFMTV